LQKNNQIAPTDPHSDTPIDMACSGAQALTSQANGRGVFVGDSMANKSQFSIVIYERRPGHWRAAVTPFAQSSSFIRGRTTSSIVTGDDSDSESEAMLAAEKLIKSF
jgi:hypothetical protein